jgi:hypothetical protein
MKVASRAGHRTSAQVTDELRELLRTAGVPAPYLLVGHSSAASMRATTRRGSPTRSPAWSCWTPPTRTTTPICPGNSTRCGPHGDPDQAFPDELPDELIEHYRGLFEQELADWPEETRELLIDRHVSPEWLRVGFQEAKNVDQLYDEVRHAGPMPDVPLIVLCSMATDSFKRAVSVGESESLLREEIEGKGGSTRRWPNPSHAARSAWSTPDTAPCTSAVPTPCSKRSRT